MTQYVINPQMAFALAWAIGNKGRKVTLVRVKTGDWRVRYN